MFAKLFCTLILLSDPVAAQENSTAPIVAVFDSVTEEKAPASSHRLIVTEKEIRASGAQNMSQLLSKLGGVSFYSTATTENQMFLRGGDGSHVLVLLDGVPFYDPTSLQRSLNINSIPLKMVGRLEIVKGAQVVRFGGQALSGVISITTLKNSEKKTQVYVEAGALEESTAPDKILARTLNQSKIEARQNVSVSANTVVQVTGSYDTSKSLSSALESEKLYPKTAYSWDVFSKTDFENYSLLMRARETRSKKDILARTTDANNFEATSNLQGASLILKPTTKNLPTAHVTLVEGHKIYYKAITDSSASAFDDSSKGQLIHVGLEQEISVQDSKWTLGASHQNESLDGFFVRGYGPMVAAKNSRLRQEINGLYSLFETPWTEDLATLVGVRHEKYLDLGEKTSSQVGLRWGAFKLEYAQGFKSPSLGQLTNVLYGNPNLKPESSRTLSAEYLWQSENTSLSLSPFWTEFDDLISTSGSPLRYYNVAETETWGSEAGLRWQGEQTAAGLNLTYQVPRERGSKDWLPRRPFWLGGLYVNTQVSEKTEMGVDLNALGKRDDQLQNGTRIQLRDNYIWNWALNHTWTENLTVSLKMRNLFHDRYQESSGYLAEGRIYLVGLQWEN